MVPEFLVNALTNDAQTLPAVAALNDGGFVISWASYDPQQGDESGLGVKARSFDADGTPREVVRLFSSIDSAEVDAAELLANDVDPEGTALTVTGVDMASANGATLTLITGSSLTIPAAQPRCNCSALGKA